MTTILRGIVGSTAYGLAREGSDVDRLGCYVEPTVKFHGLHPPVAKSASRVTENPDLTEHEAGKLVSLLLGCNPTVTELLWLPDDLYEVRTAEGDSLITLRQSALYAGGVRNAYMGYATQQFRKLSERGDGSFSSDTRKRTEKHARHLLRLCWQGFEVYRTGELPIRVDDPQRYFDFGEAVAADPNQAQAVIDQYTRLFDSTRSALPDKPDEKALEAWLISVRANHLDDKPSKPTSYPYVPPVPYTRTDLPPVVIVDIDGTVALHGEERGHYEYSKVGGDRPNTAVIQLVRDLSAGYPIAFVSGREDSCRGITQAWLHKHFGRPYQLHMRPTGDHRPDYLIKAELFDAHVRDRYSVHLVLDDRDQCIRLWRDLGLTALQVADGAF